MSCCVTEVLAKAYFGLLQSPCMDIGQAYLHYPNTFQDAKFLNCDITLLLIYLPAYFLI